MLHGPSIIQRTDTTILNLPPRPQVYGKRPLPPRQKPSGVLVTISTNGSAINYGWENTTAGLGVWYTDGCQKNITMSLTNHGEDVASNSRAELGAILEALRQNETDDLEIVLSLRAICSDATKYKDRNCLEVSVVTQTGIHTW